MKSLACSQKHVIFADTHQTLAFGQKAVCFLQTPRKHEQNPKQTNTFPELRSPVKPGELLLPGRPLKMRKSVCAGKELGGLKMHTKWFSCLEGFWPTPKQCFRPGYCVTTSPEPRAPRFASRRCSGNEDKHCQSPGDFDVRSAKPRTRFAVTVGDVTTPAKPSGGK